MGGLEEPTRLAAAPCPEPVVRIRCEVEAEARVRAALSAAGLEAERSLLHLVVRDADPDAVNAALAAGGAPARAVVRERLAALLGWLIDHQGRVVGREAQLERLVRRVVEEGGLGARYRPREAAALAQAAAEVHEHLLETGAARVPWGWFVARCLAPRQAG
jgi:hypothetical protein